MRLSSGTFHQQKLELPKGASFRPTTAKLRMQVCNICQHMIEEASILDLFAGSGAVGFELFSRGAASCVFVEKDKGTIVCLHHNIEKLGIKPFCKVFAMDATDAILKLKTSPPFSIVYIDPPYDYEETPMFASLLESIDKNLPMTTGGYLFIEGRKGQKKEFSLSTFSLLSHRKSGQSELSCYEKIT
jgi:16S rRNA (guanine966-N2)-methyltransferase